MSKEYKKKQAEKDPKSIKDIEEEIVVEQEGELATLQKQAEENFLGWQRAQADFENYKRMQGEAQKDLTRYATQSIILQLIPVLDNFNSSLAHVPEAQKADPWVTGLIYILKQLESVLSENGVSEIETQVGDTFDPVFHEALENKECQNCKDCECETKYQNRIKQVVQKGYKMGEKVIRPARVVVE